MSIVIDQAWTKASVQQLKSWDAVAAGMYVSHDPSKNATAPLIKAYAAAGIKTLLFFEDSAANALNGYAQGRADAAFALAQANALGMPSWAPVIATVDSDIRDYAPSSSDPKLKLGPAGEYLRGWCDVAGKNRTGVYGGYWVVSRAIAAGVATCAIQTIAWSGGQVDTKDIACLQNGQMLDGGQVDVEVIVSERLLDFIAWVPGEPSPHPAPVPVQRPAAAVSWAMWPPSAVLRYGSKGSAVRVLQTALSRSGIRGVRGITADGDFGNQTQTAVRNFQQVKKLAIDGIAGAHTRTALVALRDI
jgi:hypothetical protein